jgi:hypothetical protein
MKPHLFVLRQIWVLITLNLMINYFWLYLQVPTSVALRIMSNLQEFVFSRVPIVLKKFSERDLEIKCFSVFYLSQES